MALNYRAFFERIVRQRIARTEVGQRLIGTCALVFDNTMESVNHALRSAWVGDSLGPSPDALVYAGEEHSLPRYPRESQAQYEARLQRVWDDWPYAGHETSLAEQLEAAGFPGAEFYYASDWPTTGLADWWSQFWVYFPSGTHSVTAVAPEWGSFAWGDGTAYGPVGISFEDLDAMRRIIKKFKPAHYICGGIVFEISGWTYGTGHTWGEPGLVWGGESAVTGVP
jgi:hypothetical protein